ncbi:unnamed protein product [Trichobilharzia szidati]|nr:unnamed protein product [Trichobilharzia szidati]
MFNDQFNQSVYPYYNDKNIEEKGVNYALKISESYTKHQHCCIHHFIPSPVVLYTWSKLLRVEVFRQMFMEIITSSDYSRISSQCSDNLCNVGESSVIDLTSRNLPVSRQLKKLESLCSDQMVSVPAEKVIQPFSSYDESSKFQSQWLLNEWSRIYHSHDTSLKDVDCTDENPCRVKNEPFSEDTLMMLMMKVANRAPIANQQVGKGFYLDEEFPIKAHTNTNDTPRIYHPNCKFSWSDSCTENHLNDIQEDSFQHSLWRQSPLLPNKTDTTMPDYFVKPENTDPSCSSIVLSSKTNFSDVKTSFLWNTQSSSSSSSPPLPPQPPTSYSPPLNFSAFTMDQNMLCPLCHKCFRFEKNLLRHLQKTHSTSTGESLLKCKLCNYTTRHYSNMYVHIRTHTGDKPYSCSACGVAFTQGSSLKLHIRSRHNDNGSYFSLIRKPGKNNLTKLWTRVLKKDLPKFNSLQSTNSYYFYHHHQHHRHYWNKWRNSMNLEQTNRLKSIKHNKSKLTTETENLNYNLFSSTSSEFQQLPDGKHAENCINSDYWASNNTSDYRHFAPNPFEIKKYTKRSVFKTSNEGVKLKNYKRRQTSKTNTDRQFVKCQKTEPKYSSFLHNSKPIDEIEGHPLQIDERTTVKLEEPDLQDSQSGICSTIILNQLFLHNRQMNQDIHETTDANNDNNNKSNMAVLAYQNKSDIQYQEEYLPFSIAALQPY